MAKKDEDFLRKLMATFAVEADEHIKAISAGLLELEKTAATGRRNEIVENITREAHSLKGAARAVNHAGIVSVCQSLESIFIAVSKKQVQTTPQLFDLLHESVGALERILSAGVEQAVTDESPLVKTLVGRLDGAAAGIGDPGYAVREPAPAPVAEPRTPLPGTVRITTAKLDALFRQAEELIAVKLVSERRIAELRELAATLKLARKVSGKIHSRILAQQAVSERERNLSGAPYSTWLEESETAELSARSAAGSVDALIAAAAADHRALAKMIDHLLEEAKQLLMQPLSELFEILPKAVRDLAREQGKEVELSIQGGAIEIDRRIQEQLKDPLLHLLRNCVDHGIEKPAERARKHKPASGKITISVTQPDAGKAEFIIADDGAGIDYAKVLAAARRSGAVTTETAARMNDQEIAELVFRSGVSSSPIVTDISGRGLGLAIAREKIEKLNGNILLESRPDAGTVFRIILPVTLSASRGVVVRAADRFFALPTLNVERVVRVRTANIKTVENRETLPLNGHTLSLVHLAHVLGLRENKQPNPAGDLTHVVVLTAGGERMAFAVDEIHGEQELLLKGLGNQLVRIRNIAGSTALGSGELVPFLNVTDLMQASVVMEHVPGDESQAQAAATREKSVLVVEDSITARSLLKNILEAAGYRVKTAVDGMDALTGLKTEAFDLVVSDVEMPRMDGFELTEKIRADRKLAELPVVLVTALDNREHRERGIEAGANAYIAKSGFDESGLLDIIRRLI